MPNGSARGLTIALSCGVILIPQSREKNLMLRQPVWCGGETAPAESGPQRVGAVGLIQNPTYRRAHVAHGLFQHAGGVDLVAAARLDFHCHALGAALDHEVNLRAVGCSPEEELCEGG